MLGYRTSKRSNNYPSGNRFDALERARRSKHTLGSIIWFALLRLVATIVISWYLRDYFGSNYGEWWIVTIASIYGIAIYPAQIQYEYFRAAHKKLIEETLCSSCRYFNPDGLHCTKLDAHITELYLPCEGMGWEPSRFEDAYYDEQEG